MRAGDKKTLLYLRSTKRNPFDDFSWKRHAHVMWFIVEEKIWQLDNVTVEPDVLQNKPNPSWFDQRLIATGNEYSNKHTASLVLYSIPRVRHIQRQSDFVPYIRILLMTEEICNNFRYWDNEKCPLYPIVSHKRRLLFHSTECISK